MVLVVPTILAATVADFDARLRRVKPFAPRLHVDVTDGVFSDSPTVGFSDIHGLSGLPFDLHLMLRRPQDDLKEIIALRPSLVIFHAEADCDHREMAEALKAAGVRAGLAILPETSADDVRHLLPWFDHVMVFTGTLGQNGGDFHADCLDKIGQLRAMRPELEIGVDGGVTLQNIAAVAAAGADVIYVGGAIHHAANPAVTYEALTRAALSAAEARL